MEFFQITIRRAMESSQVEMQDVTIGHQQQQLCKGGCQVGKECCWWRLAEATGSIIHDYTM